MNAFAPLEALTISLRKEAVWKATTNPKDWPALGERSAISLFQKWSQLHISNPACQGFGRLLQEINRSRSKQKELSAALPFSPSPVNEAAKRLEDSRKTMDFVENNEPIFVLHQIQFRISQLCAGLKEVRGRGRGRFVSLRLRCETQR